MVERRRVSKVSNSLWGSLTITLYFRLLPEICNYTSVTVGVD